MSLHKSSKYSKIGPYGLGALLLITVAVILRVVLISNGWPSINSDEAITGLQALHILTRGERPIFSYGLPYLGTIQSYLGAFCFLLFGPSTFALRLGLVALYAGFLLVLYLLTGLLYNKDIALATLFLLCWGSSYTLDEQLWAYGGRLEILLFATLSFLLASWLALSFHSDTSSREQRKRLLAYGCLGCMIGLGIWSDLVMIPFACTSLLLPLLFCRRELHASTILAGVLGYLIGAFPLLLYHILHPQISWLGTLSSHYQTDSPQDPRLTILGTTLITIPAATGANPLCPLSAARNQWVHQLSLPCITFQACWGLGVIIVWALAAFVVTKELREHHRAFSISGSQLEKEHLVRCACRLMLLISAGLTVLAYTASPNGAIAPLNSKRYLIELPVVAPAIVAYLWPRCSLNQLTNLVTKWTIAKSIDITKIGILCFINIVLFIGMVNIFFQIPNTQNLIQRQNTLINGLLRIHALHIYSDYWTCNRLIFLSNERIICSVLNVDWSIGWYRYAPYLEIVQQDPHSAYVFDIEKHDASYFDTDNYDQASLDGIPMNQTFTQHFGTQYHRLYLAGYAIYLPVNKHT